MSANQNCRQCATCAKFIPDTAPGPDHGPAYCDEHRPEVKQKIFNFYTERTIEIVAGSVEEAWHLVHAHLHTSDDETILRCEEQSETAV